ncbi:M23 family metallopeptidase [Lichenihabitans sp. PAMC28606]|uniref:M23 family metallopeptidase n=1 Tax=Lichenihabitans sp. PAMC28606 TaxID=2880932 RepID=UPI001D0B1E14|nr:M23 family metallopeptidase [Lichenihabitans sp. PAMC28606]UDL95288.1 M23 family metallopeptidase [Lichenihabitans sp. PAMC28606]
MSPLPIGTAVPSSRSRYVVSIARGNSHRGFTVRVDLAWSVIGLLIGMACGGVGASIYLAFHDDMVASLMAEHASMQYGYEDQIAALQSQIRHDAGRGRVQQSSLDTEMRALTIRAERLETRSNLLGQLAEAAGAARPQSGRASHDPAVAIRTTIQEAGAAAIDNPLSSPSPAVAPVVSGSDVTGSIRDMPTDAGGVASSGDDETASIGPGGLNGALADVAEALERVDASQFRAIAAVDQTARKTSDDIVSIVAASGLSATRLKGATPVDAPLGGPFVALPVDRLDARFGSALAGLQADVANTRRLVASLPLLPYAAPVQGVLDVTSPFGPRLDPFLGRPALHTGVDLREAYGAEVRATAAGRVMTAGATGGYGTMVEVDHGNGLSTRYAHLASVLVTPGQRVARGDVLGHVGATGRATGPHLHYETRIDGEAVNPTRFLEAGQRLAALHLAP